MHRRREAHSLTVEQRRIFLPIKSSKAEFLKYNEKVYVYLTLMDFPGGLVVDSLPFSAGDAGSTPGW